MIDKIREALNRNPNLSGEFKEAILNSVMLLVNSPFISNKEGFNYERLATLDVDKVNNYVGFGFPANYVGSENKLKLNPSALSKANQNHVLLQQLLNIVTYTENANPLEIEKNQAIFEGYSSLVAKNVLASNGLDSESEYDYYFDEEVVVNLLGEIVGGNVLESVYMSKNIELLVISLKNKGVSEKDITNLLSLINHNQKTRNMTKLSNLAGLQKELIKVSKKLNLDIKEIKRNIVDSEKYLANETIRYQGIEEIKNYYNITIESREIQSPVKETEEEMIR